MDDLRGRSARPEKVRAIKTSTVLAIVGPTCTGKTRLSIELASLIDGEIVACDSRTVYRHMDIGTAKPTASEQAGIPHHMLDVADPDEQYSAARYAGEARAAIAGIVGRGRLPIVVGGTGFYARSLLEGLAIPPVGPQDELRQELREFAERHGNEALHKRLAALDPESAARLSVNDVFRVVRALEVSIVTGSPFSRLASRQDAPYRVVWIGLTAQDRTYLHERIKARFREQMECGLLEETRELVRRFGRCHSIRHTVNYKELSAFLAGELSLPEAEMECVRHNRQLARRQLTWFRANASIQWYPVDTLKPDILLSDVRCFLSNSL